MTKIAILASGRGSNAQAIVGAIKDGQLNAEVMCVISDRPDAGVLKLDLGVPSHCVSPDSSIEDRHQRKAEHEERILAHLKGCDFVCLAGYMRLLSPKFISAFDSERGYSKIINVHPSLLPEFKGKDAYAQAWGEGVHETGVTLHLVDEEMDHGPILAQESFTLGGMDTLEDVEAFGLSIEHRLYVETLQWVLAGDFEVKGSKVVRKS